MARDLLSPLASTLAGKIRGEGVSLTDDNNASVKFPGQQRMEFTLDQLGELRSIFRAETRKGDDPVSVFRRTMVEGPDGSVSGQFSDAPRSRTLSLTRKDREDVADLLDEVFSALEGAIIELESAENEKNEAVA